jgi:hypothetical protein
MLEALKADSFVLTIAHDCGFTIKPDEGERELLTKSRAQTKAIANASTYLSENSAETSLSHLSRLLMDASQFEEEWMFILRPLEVKVDTAKLIVKTACVLRNHLK